MATCSIPLHILKYRETGVHLYIHVRINGKPARLIIDTGASLSVLDVTRVARFHNGNDLKKHKMKAIGLGTSDMQSFLLKSVSLKAGKVVFEPMEFMCIDLSRINAAFQSAKLKPADGVIGGNFLLHYKAVIDYSKRRIFLNV